MFVQTVDAVFAGLSREILLLAFGFGCSSRFKPISEFQNLPEFLRKEHLSVTPGRDFLTNYFSSSITFACCNGA